MKWRYPLSDIDLGKEEEQAVVKVLRSRWLSTGPVTKKFESDFSKYLGEGYAIAVSNGTAALHLALASLEIKEGDEVILPALTFVATANAVVYAGGKPVFADILGFDNFNISPEEIELKITEKTKAIIVMHYGGFPCDMEAILSIAGRHGIKVIEDSAHAPGAEYQGKKCGTMGELGCFSFFSNKNIATGEGGLVFTKNKKLAEKIKRMRSHGMKSLSWDKYKGRLSNYDINELGYNYRITEIQSAIGIVQLKKLDQNNYKRKQLFEAYRKEFQEIKGVSIPYSIYEGKPSYHIFPILFEPSINREKIIQSLRNIGIQTSIHYPPVHLFSFYRKKFGFRSGMLPRTEEVSRREITLPLHPLMSIRDVKWIADKIKEIIHNQI